MAEPSPATLTVTADPSPTEQQQVIALIGRAAAVDGHPAVNEAGLLALRSPDRDRAAGAVSRHVLVHDQGTGELIGYAQAIGDRVRLRSPQWSSTRSSGARASARPCGDG